MIISNLWVQWSVCERDTLRSLKNRIDTSQDIAAVWKNLPQIKEIFGIFIGQKIDSNKELVSLLSDSLDLSGFEQARILLVSKEYDDAIKFFESILRESKRDTLVDLISLFNLWSIYSEEDYSNTDIANALKYYQQCIDLADSFDIMEWNIWKAKTHYNMALLSSDETTKTYHLNTILLINSDDPEINELKELATYKFKSGV
jgi:tetratricopeptide (TPR) repeat protein